VLGGLCRRATARSLYWVLGRSGVIDGIILEIVLETVGSLRKYFERLEERRSVLMMVGQLLRLSSWHWSSWHLSGFIPCEKLERVKNVM